MSKKLRSKKDLIITEKDDKEFIKYPYVFTSSNVYNKNTVFLNSQPQTSMYNLQCLKLTQMSGIDILSKSSSEKSKLNKKKKDKNKNVQFNLLNSLITQKSPIIPETAEVSFRSTSPYCSQTLYNFIKPENPVGFENIIQSLAKKSTYSTPQISECSTISQSNTEETISGIDEEISNSNLTQNHQSIENLRKLSLHSQNNKPAKIATDNFVLQKSEKVEDEINVLSSKFENNRIILSKHLYDEQLIKVSTADESHSIINCNFKKQYIDLHTDSDITLSGVNLSSLSNIIDSDINFNITHFPNEITPVKNKNIDDIKGTNLSEINAENKNNADKNFKEKNIIFEKFSTNLHLNTKYKKNDLTPTLSTDFSMFSIKNADCKNQNLHEEFMVNSKCTNSSLSTAVSQQSTNLSFQLSKQKSFYNNKILGLDSIENQLKDNSSLKNKSQTMNSIGSQNIQNSSKEIHSQSLLLSLPLSDDNVDYMLLPSNIFISNYCCEYDKAYTKKDLKPTSYRNYYSNKIINSLKEHFDKAITPKKSLETFFKTSENVSEQFEIDLQKTIENILLMLENELNC